MARYINEWIPAFLPIFAIIVLVLLWMAWVKSFESPGNMLRLKRVLLVVLACSCAIIAIWAGVKTYVRDYNQTYHERISQQILKLRGKQRVRNAGFTSAELSIIASQKAGDYEGLLYVSQTDGDSVYTLALLKKTPPLDCYYLGGSSIFTHSSMLVPRGWQASTDTNKFFAYAVTLQGRNPAYIGFRSADLQGDILHLATKNRIYNEELFFAMVPSNYMPNYMFYDENFNEIDTYGMKNGA